MRAHLLECPACNRLEARLKAQHALISGAKKSAPPERVWHNIRRAITTVKVKEESRVSLFQERLKEYFIMRRTAFIMATALTAAICVIIAAGAIMRNRPFYAGNGEDILTIYTLNGPTSDLLNDFGTAIEEYFL